MRFTPKLRWRNTLVKTSIAHPSPLSLPRLSTLNGPPERSLRLNQENQHGSPVFPWQRRGIGYSVDLIIIVYECTHVRWGHSKNVHYKLGVLLGHFIYNNGGKNVYFFEPTFHWLNGFQVIHHLNPKFRPMDQGSNTRISVCFRKYSSINGFPLFVYKRFLFELPYTSQHKLKKSYQWPHSIKVSIILYPLPDVNHH